MRAISLTGILFFFIHYLTTLFITTLFKVVRFTWAIITRTTNNDKIRLNPIQAVHPHVFENIYDVISNEGFQLEVLQFQTADRAMVEMWRICKQDCPSSKPYPILLMHGLLDCSSSWLMHPDKTKTLPYILAAEGYQVWVGNNRGNRISQPSEHPDPAFWDYNLDHMVDYDQPTIIEGVLRYSEKEKLIYVGHSQGSAQFILGMGVHHHLHQKIAGFVGLGSVVSLKNLERNILLKSLQKFKLLELCHFIGLKKVLALPAYLSKSIGILIYNSKFHFQLVLFFIRLLCGFSVKNKISDIYFGVMLTHEPGGTSANNIIQWIDCYRNGNMRRFDYGSQKNKELYGSEDPQEYCLKHLSTLPFKSFLFKGQKDAVMKEQNFKELVSRFHPERITTYGIPDYHHLEYLWSQTAHQDVYPLITQIAHECSQ